MMRVLIADDESPARDKLQRWLSEQVDIEVVARAEDGLQAAAAIEHLRPDVVYLDIQMPGLNGLEVAAQLEQDTAPLIDNEDTSFGYREITRRTTCGWLVSRASPWGPVTRCAT